VARPTISAGPVPLSPSSCSNIGDIAEYAIPSLSFPFAITAGPDGNLWFTELDAGNIGRICAKKNVAENCTAIGAITPYPAQGIGPWGITAAPDGQLWFTTISDGYIRSMNTAGVVTGSYAVPAGNPGWITAGPDGALWFVGGGYPASYIGRICVKVSPGCPSVGALTDPPYFVSSDINGLVYITPGPDGAIWFSGFKRSGTGLIGRITTDGKTVNYYDVDFAEGITSGPDGAVWFASVANLGQALPSARRNGIDISFNADGPISSTVAQNFFQAGVRYAVVKIPQKSLKNWDDRNIAREQLTTLHNAGIETAGYCLLYFDQEAQDGDVQVQNCFDTLTERPNLLGDIAFMAIDVEETKPEYHPHAHGLIQEALKRITDVLGQGKAVIYTAEYFWKTMTHNDTGFSKKYPLWTAATYSFESYVDPAGELYCFGAGGLVPNKNQSGPNGGIPSLQSFVPFAGWSEQQGNQYDIGYLHNGSFRSQCLFGTIVDFDVFDSSLFGSK